MSLQETVEFCREKVLTEGRRHNLFDYFIEGEVEIRLRDSLQGTDGLSVYIGDNPVIMENKAGRIIRIHGSWVDVERWRLFGRF